MIDVAAPSPAPDRAPRGQGPGDSMSSPPLMDRRGPRSLRKPATEAAEDPDTDAGDADEAEIVGAGEEVREGADGALADPTFIGSVAGRPGGRRATAFVNAANREGVTDFTVDTAEAGTPTTVRTESGNAARIRLAPGERSREVQVGGETVLVLDADLSAAEAQKEVADYIAERFGAIANDLGLADPYLPFLTYLFENGSKMLCEHYGTLGMPLEFISQLFSTWRTDQADDRRAGRRLAERRPDQR